MIQRRCKRIESFFLLYGKILPPIEGKIEVIAKNREAKAPGTVVAVRSNDDVAQYIIVHLRST